MLNIPHPDLSDRVLDRDEIHRPLQQLPARQRAAVVLRYHLGLDDAAIGVELGASSGAVRTLISRALTGLQASVDVERGR